MLHSFTFCLSPCTMDEGQCMEGGGKRSMISLTIVNATRIFKHIEYAKLSGRVFLSTQLSRFEA